MTSRQRPSHPVQLSVLAVEARGRVRGLGSAAACALLGAATLLAACAPAGSPDAGGNSARDRGELLSLACQACHTFGAGQGHQIGPNLYGIFGRSAGTAEGFNYSAAMRAQTFVWTPAELDRWLADPAGFLPGTTMSFTGYQSPEDRAALIDYLVTATAADGP